MIKAEYIMNLASRTAMGGSIINNRAFCMASDTLSRVHRAHPQLRRTMSNLSAVLRRALGLKDAFYEIPSPGSVSASFRIRESRIDIEIEFPLIVGCTEKIVLNEQGANWFDTYRDSDGLTLKGNEIGTWDETHANSAALLNPAGEISFTLKHIEGARMFRGREQVSDRLAWSGLAYVLPPKRERFAYSIEIGGI